MNQPFEPKDDRLHALLRESRPAPVLPPRFQESVWRRIESAEARSAWEWLARLAEGFLRPRIAITSLALALVAGALAGVLTSAEVTKQQAEQRYLASVAPNPIR